MRLFKHVSITLILGIGLFLFSVFSIYAANDDAQNSQVDDFLVQQNKIKHRTLAQSGSTAGVLSSAELLNCVPGELIVKLKANKRVDSLQVLNNKYGVISYEKVFKDIPAPKDKIKSLKERLAQLDVQHDSWYWQLDKESQEYKDYIAKVEKDKQALEQQIKQEEAKLNPPNKGTIYSKVKDTVDLRNIYLLKTKDVQIDISRMTVDYLSNPNIEYAEPNYIAKATVAPNDPYYRSTGGSLNELWGIKRISCEKTWDLFALGKSGPGFNFAGEGMVVAVVDTGIDYTHPDLADNIWRNPGEIPDNGIDDDNNGYVDDIMGWNFINNSSDILDRYGHGSHVAGIIAAVGNNGIGVIGVAPQAKIMVLKGLNDNEGFGNDEGLARCVQYAVDNGAQVINNSYGGYGRSKALTDVFHYAHDKACVTVSASGNEGDNSENYYPGNIDTTITVGASGTNDWRLTFSNWGGKVDIAAPGAWVLSTMPDTSVLANQEPFNKISNGYWWLNGTSMACPHVSGLAALVIQRLLKHNPLITQEVDQVRDIIRFGADDIGVEGIGSGRINAYKTLSRTPAHKVKITSPSNDDYIRGSVQIVGGAFLNEGFRGYQLYYAPAEDLNDIHMIVSSATTVGIPTNEVSDGVRDGILGTWDTTECNDGHYRITLKVNTAIGEYRRDVDIGIENVNEPPQFLRLVNRIAFIGEPLIFKVETGDPDDPNTDEGKLECSASGSLITNGKARFDFDAKTNIGTFTWNKPEAIDKGVYDIVFTLRDKARDDPNIITRTISISTCYIQEALIVDTSGVNTYPDTFNNKVVWENSGSIRMAYLDKGDEFPWEDIIGRPNPYCWKVTGLVISEDKIVWQENEDIGNTDFGNWDIYMYDLKTGKEEKITTEGHDQCHPDIFGDKIVWQDNRNGNWDIYMYDCKTKKTEPVITGEHDQTYPSIFMDSIAWEDTRDGQPNIYMIDPSMREPVKIGSGGKEEQYYPSLSGSVITWLDAKNNIHFFNIDNQQEAVAVSSRYQFENPPRFRRNKVALVRSSGSNKDVYVLKFFIVPRIMSIEPSIVISGSEITINGTNFDKEEGARVEFSNNISAAEIKEWDGRHIKCIVPSAAKSGQVKVVTLGGVSNSIPIEILSPPESVVSPVGITAPAVTTALPVTAPVIPSVTTAVVLTDIQPVEGKTKVSPGFVIASFFSPMTEAITTNITKPVVQQLSSGTVSLATVKPVTAIPNAVVAPQEKIGLPVEDYPEGESKLTAVAQEPQAAKMNFIADYNDDGSISEVSVLDVHGDLAHSYEVEKKRSQLILKRDDGSKIKLILDRKKNVVKKTTIEESKGIPKNEIEEELQGMLPILGF